jgi:hypothetical protein
MAEGYLEPAKKNRPAFRKLSFLHRSIPVNPARNPRI